MRGRERKTPASVWIPTLASHVLGVVRAPRLNPGNKTPFKTAVMCNEHRAHRQGWAGRNAGLSAGWGMQRGPPNALSLPVVALLTEILWVFCKDVWFSSGKWQRCKEKWRPDPKVASNATKEALTFGISLYQLTKTHQWLFSGGDVCNTHSSVLLTRYSQSSFWLLLIASKTPIRWWKIHYLTNLLKNIIPSKLALEVPIFQCWQCSMNCKRFQRTANF